MNIKRAYSFAVLLSFILINIYFDGILFGTKLAIALGIYSLVGYFFYWIWKKVTFREIKKYPQFLGGFFYSVANMLVLFVIIIGSFVYYYNFVSPAYMPRYTLSNGEKTVIFQAMIHIGSQDFYKQVEESIREAKKQGYILFYEGVRPGTQENMKAFNKAIGIKFDPELYKNFSQLYGVSFQDNSRFLGIVNNYDYNVDLSIDEIMKLYSQKQETKKSEKSQEVIDMSKKLTDYISQLHPKKLELIVMVNKALLNFLIQNEKLQAIILEDFSNTALFDVILHERNTVISDAIEENTKNQIYVTYGLLHFVGVFENLLKNDGKWKILKEEKIYPISSPSL